MLIVIKCHFWFLPFGCAFPVFASSIVTVRWFCFLCVAFSCFFVFALFLMFLLVVFCVVFVCLHLLLP